MKPLFSFVEEERGFSHPHFCRRILEERGKQVFLLRIRSHSEHVGCGFSRGIAVEHASLVFCGCDFGVEVIPCGKTPCFRSNPLGFQSKCQTTMT